MKVKVEATAVLRERLPKFTMAHAPSITLANQNAYRAQGTCTKKGAVVTVSVASLNPQTGTCSKRIEMAGDGGYVSHRHW